MLIKRPIYNWQLKCSAYEILSKQLNAKKELMAQQLLHGISESNKQLPIFIPFQMKTVLEQLDEPLTNPIILVLHAHDIGSLHTLEEVKDSLFSIALLIDKPQHLDWIHLADYIGLTKGIIDDEGIEKTIQFIQSKQRKIIAYGIKNSKSFEKYSKMTIDYFCGEFIFEPNIDNKSTIAANQCNFMELLCLLQDDQCNSKAVSKLIQSDPLLSFQLLKLANSASYAGYQPIENIDQAILRLGIMNLRHWAMLFSLKNVSQKPLELLESGLLRAHMAAKLAGNVDNLAQKAYTVGLLSILDSLLDRPLIDLIEEVKLADEIKQALLQKTGPLGELLRLVVCYEEGNWDMIGNLIYNGQDLSQVYIECLEKVSKERKNMLSV